MCRPPRPLLSLATLLVTLPLLAASDVPPQALPGVFGEVIDVRVVNVEVVVTDRDGNRVSGLAPGDFRLTVDGKPAPIDYFSEVRGGAAVAAEATGTGAVLPASLPSLVPGSPVGTSYLIFIDDYFAIATHRNRVLDQLADSLADLGPGDRMAIVAFDGRRLEMLSSWSDSTPALARALRQAKQRPAYGLNRTSERRSLLSDRGSSRRVDGGFAFSNSPLATRLDEVERAYAARLQSQLGNEVSAAVATLRSFSSPPGRKVMLLLSGGWPFDPVEYAADERTVPLEESGIDRGFKIFRPLADTANLLGYTLYPVDLPGLQVQAASAEVGPSPSVSQVSRSQDFLIESNFDSSLTYLAAKTGGRALINGLRDGALDRVSSDTRSYYWLGFSVDRRHDDKGHAIDVEVTRRGLRVRSRAGYLDLSRREEVSMMVESSLLFGSAPPAAALPVEVGKAKRSGFGTVEVPISIAIPADQVTLVAADGHWTGELELRVAALDAAGGQSDVPVTPIHFTLDKQPRPGDRLRYEAKVKLRRGKQDLVVAVYDPATGHLLSNRLEVDL